MISLAFSLLFLALTAYAMVAMIPDLEEEWFMRGLRGLLANFFTFRRDMVPKMAVVWVGVSTVEIFIIHSFTWRSLSWGFHPHWNYLPGSELILAWIVAPVEEEILARGFIFQHFKKRHGLVAGVVVSALAFAFGHELALMGWPYTLNFVIFGVAQALLVHRTGSLTPAILSHAAYNLLISVLGW